MNLMDEYPCTCGDDGDPCLCDYFEDYYARWEDLDYLSQISFAAENHTFDLLMGTKLNDPHRWRVEVLQKAVGPQPPNYWEGTDFGSERRLT